MSYFAAAIARGKNGWTTSELDLTGVADLDEVADRLRDAETDADLSLLFVESDDQYLVILRLDEAEDLRVFGSDSAFADESRLGALLLAEIEAPAIELDDLAVDADAEPAADAETDDPDTPPVADPDADPVGDADLLADLGVPAHRLLALCGSDGMLPADVTAELAQRMGFGDELEELRDA